jgi:hypothetical protein
MLPAAYLEHSELKGPVCAASNALEETLKEGFPQSMGSARVNKECQEVGVLQFLPDDANGLEQVERGEQIFESPEKLEMERRSTAGAGQTTSRGTESAREPSSDLGNTAMKRLNSW